VARARTSNIAIVSETFVARRVFANSIIVSLTYAAAFQVPTAKNWRMNYPPQLEEE
jgi:hypothetical protein